APSCARTSPAAPSTSRPGSACAGAWPRSSGSSPTRPPPISSSLRRAPRRGRRIGEQVEGHAGCRKRRRRRQSRPGREGGPVSDTAPSPADSRNPPLPQLVTELWDLIVAYFKQETVVPLRQLGRWIAFGILGALLLGVGVLLLAMAGLRALQEETGTTFTGNLSWIPYMILFAALLVGGAITWKARGARRRRKASS